MREMIKKLIEQRARAWEHGKEILERGAAEERALTAEELEEWDRVNGELTELDERIDELTELEARNAKAGEAREAYERLSAEEPAHRAREEKTLNDVVAFLKGETRSLDISFAGLSAERNSNGRLEVRDLTVGTAAAGGDTVPTSFARTLYEYVIDSAAILQTRATVVRTTSGEQMEFPKNDAGGSATLVTEGNAIAENDPTFAKMALNAYKYATLVQISRELVEDSAVDILGFIARDAGRAVGDDFGEDAIVGDGTAKPNGVITAGTSNVSANTGVSGAPQEDDLIDLYYGTKAGYARNGEWIMARATEGGIRKLTDAVNGQFLWQPGLQIASPNMLLGAPIINDEFVAATGVNNKSAAFGDFSSYYVRMVNGVRFERSDDFAFANDLVSFRAVLRADGDLIDPNAIQVHTGAAT